MSGDEAPRGEDPNATIDTGAPAGEGPVFAGRYRCTTKLGQGSFGVVWRAVDEATGADVAVKVHLGGTTQHAERARREVVALSRLHRYPGVVQLLDSGLEEGRLFIVMEIAPGTPFPGDVPPVRWEALQPVVRALLEALRGVHVQGLVHRDLKPGNVLVDGERVTILDFGISRGGALGHTITARHGVLGSAPYLAPEQVLDRPKDARTDLYAVGAMMFEALSGGVPFPASTLAEVIASRTTRDAPPLRRVAPAVPEGVAAVVDRLLRRDPDERFPSAEAVVAALGGSSVLPGLPWLGGDGAVEALVASARARRAMDLGGTPGAGRSRTLREAADRLEAEGHVVHRVPPGRRGLESLRPVVGELGGDDARVEAERRLHERLGGGEVLVVDDPARVDWVSRGVIDRARGRGAVLRVVDGPGDVRPEPLDEVDLRPLFHGPDLVHHLPVDGARALYRRTAAHPARVVAEVDAWVFAGLAAWEHGRLRTTRAALERVELGVTPRPPVASAPTLEQALDELLGWILLAGPGVNAGILAQARERDTWEIEEELAALRELGAVRVGVDGSIEAVVAPAILRAWSTEDHERVHRRLAHALTPGAAGRLAHLAGAKELAALADEALVVAGRLIPDGRLGTAAALLELGLQAVRGTGERARERALARELTRAALGEGSVPLLRRVRYLVDPVDPRLGALIEAWALAQQDELDRADAVRIAPLEDEELEGYRHLVRVRRLAHRDAAAAEAYVASLASTPGSALERRKREWVGQIRFLTTRYQEAAALHQQQAVEEPGIHRRVSALINVALALREDYAYEAALDRFEVAAQLAAEHRLPALEAHARLGVRTLLYRLGRTGRPDLVLVEAIEQLGIVSVTAQIRNNEAAAAWRAGELAVANDLARKAMLGFRSIGRWIGEAFATALARATGSDVDVEWLLGERVRGAPIVAFQVGALLVAAGDDRGRALVGQGVASLDRTRWTVREAVMSMEEAVVIVSGV